VQNYQRVFRVDQLWNQWNGRELGKLTVLKTSTPLGAMSNAVNDMQKSIRIFLFAAH
jgi:hypothetical protein